MIPHLVYYQLVILVLLWLCLMLSHLWPSPPGGAPKTPTPPIRPKRKRSTEPKPFAGLTQKPHCALCEQAVGEKAPAPPRRPDPIPPSNRRPRTVDTSMHFCPHTDCDYRGWLGLNNLRANGHPSGASWRQFHCTSCDGYFPEHHGTIFHGKHAAVELIVHVLACLAEGLGIRATARVFEVDANTVLHWLIEAAEQLRTFSRDFLREVHAEQLQLDELYAVLRDLKAGEISEDEAIKGLERSPYWVWTAMEPGSKLLLVIDVGTRTLEMAQRVVHQVEQVLARGCVPLCLTDGYRDYTMAFLAHWGHWVQPECKRDRGPAPKPRWMPLPELLYAQVVKSYRRRRIVGVKYRVVFGTMERVQQVLSACGRKINTAFVERLNLNIRQHVAAVGRRVNTLCQGEDGLRQPLVVYQVYYNFCLPHVSLRQPLLVPEPTNGSGSAKLWRPYTPAMAAGVTDHVWSLKEVLLYRVPPWPQPQVQ
jgi:IS1 family transposase